MLKKKQILIFADTTEESEAALKFRESNLKDECVILATTPIAQNVLAKKGLDYYQYVKLLPDLHQVEKIVRTANEFAISWFKGTVMEPEMNFQGMNLAYYLIGYWTNLLCLYLMSEHVFHRILHFYNPKSIYYFPKDLSVESAINSDYFILEKCGRKFFRNEINLLAMPVVSPKTVITKRKKFIRKLLSLPNYGLDIFLILRIFGVRYLQKIGIIPSTIEIAEILIYGDKHIITNAIALIMTLRLHFTVSVVGTMLSFDQRLKLEKEGISYCNFEDLPKSPINEKQLAKILNTWDRFKSSQDYRQMLDKFHLLDIEEAMTSSFDSYFKNHLPNVFVTLNQTKELITRVKPKATILFGNYGKKGLSLSYETKKAGGKVFILEHGIVPNPIQIHPPIYDWMLFWGNWSRRGFYNAFHEPLSGLKVVGWFLTDDIISVMNEYRKVSNEQGNMQIGKITVLLLTTFPAYDFPKQLKMIRDVIKTLNDLGISELIIRPHPGENLSADITVDGLRKNFKLTWDFGADLDCQIKKADIVITEGTSVALRVMMWGKPLLHLVTENIVDYTNFSRFGAAIKISHISQLKKAVQLLTQNKKARLKMFAGQEKSIRDFCFKMDGKASERVAFLVRKQAF